MRFCLTNTANTRVFNVTLPGARVKLVGGDSGRYEHEEFVDEVILSPSERVVIDVLFQMPGEFKLEHRTPEHTSASRRSMSAETAGAVAGGRFDRLRTNRDMMEPRADEPFFDSPPDKTLSFVAEMDMGEPEGVRSSTSVRCTRRSSARSPAAARNAG